MGEKLAILLGNFDYWRFGLQIEWGIGYFVKGYELN